MSDPYGHRPAADQAEGDCGCCAGVRVSTPAPVRNAPGRDAIAYRVGTHSQFRRSMVAGLSDADLPELSALTTRDGSDIALALLDAWATTADVLTFYQERIANESYLRTATERRSLQELGRAIGYELRPGVAVDVDLAFTVDGAPGSPGATTIEAGTRAQSIPGPGERAQSFETIESIPARAAWNAIKPRQTRRHPIEPKMPGVLIAGLDAGLRVGDVVLIQPDDVLEVSPPEELRQVTRTVQRQDIQAELTRTEVLLGAAIGTDGQPIARTEPRIVGGRLPEGGGAIAAFATSAAEMTALPARQVAATDVGTDLDSVFFGQEIETSDFADAYMSQDGIAYADLQVYGYYQAWTINSVFKNYVAATRRAPVVTTFRTRASLFGHNAPKLKSLPSSLWEVQGAPYFGRDTNNTWSEGPLDNYLIEIDGQPLTATQPSIYLDAIYPGIAARSDKRPSYVVLQNATDHKWERFEVVDVSEVFKDDFTFATKVTQLTLDRPLPAGTFIIRSTMVFVQSEDANLARLPLTEPVATQMIPFDGLVEDLYPGQRLIFCGEPTTDRGNPTCEPATIKEAKAVGDDEGYARVQLEKPLANSYARSTVTIYGNVARATHGETKTEVLGSGDAAQPYQRFPLKQPPLTYITTAAGAESTLRVEVNGIRWQETPTLYDQPPTARVYTTRNDDEGRTTIQFGDGRFGARVPSGQENVRAVYRSGIGLGGRVVPGQVSLLLSRPSGVSGVTNPMATTGGEDPERLEQARERAPLGIVTLDRIVSLRDYEDYARSFPNVAKALATWTWDGTARGVLLTVAGADGASIPDGSPTHIGLLAALRRDGDPNVPVVVRSYVRRLFRAPANVTADPDYGADALVAAVQEALRERFSFAARSFGQPVRQGEVLATIQRVPGVVAVDLTGFSIFDPGTVSRPDGGTGGTARAAPASDILQPVLFAQTPEPGGPPSQASATLLTIDPGLVSVEVHT